MNTKRIAFNITNGLMNVFTASLMSPETEQTPEAQDVIKENIMKLLTDATINFEDAINEFLNRDRILVPKVGMDIYTKKD